MAGVGQQGERVGFEAVDDLGDDKQTVERRGQQEARAEIGRNMVVMAMAMAVIMTMMVTMIMPGFGRLAVPVVVPMIVVIVVIVSMMRVVVTVMIMTLGIRTGGVSFVRHASTLGFSALQRKTPNGNKNTRKQ